MGHCSLKYKTTKVTLKEQYIRRFIFRCCIAVLHELIEPLIMVFL